MIFFLSGIQVSGYSIQGGLKDRETTLRLITEHKCDVVTTEIEHVNADALEEIQRSGTDMQPSANTIRIIQDKFVQKEHFAAKGVALPPYMKTDTLEEVKQAGRYACIRCAAPCITRLKPLCAISS
jgi:phosphoribosylaminoimidazole carboxylase (NCAIR synthetase)